MKTNEGIPPKQQDHPVEEDFFTAYERLEKEGRERSLSPKPGHKICPHCAEKIKADARVCRYCHKRIRRMSPRVRKAIWIFAIVLVLSVMKAIATANYNNSIGGYTSSPVVASSMPTGCDEQATLHAAKAAAHLVRDYDSRGNLIGSGSGMALTDSTPGLVLTNYHVIQGVKTIRVWIGYDGNKDMDASVYAAYPDQDIAILKVDYSFHFTMSLSNSDMLKDAETVYTVGWPNSPSGEATITKGILSRRVTDSGRELLQTDATINPGNSGGPLVSACGVVGMNTEKLVWSSAYVPAEGTGYALSSNYIRSVAYPNNPK